MAANTLTQDRRDAGRDYLIALRGLGLEPEGLLWAVHNDRKEWQLALVTSLVDRIGSLKVYETLLDAYNRAGTPRCVDPFVVSLYSPESLVATQLRTAFDIEILGDPITLTQNGRKVDLGEPWFGAGNYLFRKSWVYVALRRIPESRHQLHEWERFRSNVERLAA